MNTANILSDLKSKGHKNTKTREAIIEILVKSQTPLSVPEILEKLVIVSLKPNKTTLYREVDFLKKQDLVKEVEFGDGKKRYEISSEHHHHIICVNCHSIKDIPMEKELNEKEMKIIKKLGYKPIGHSLEFFGLCSKCQKLMLYTTIA
jgi:Fur family ferric uptake transcriptional regulator